MNELPYYNSTEDSPSKERDYGVGRLDRGGNQDNTAARIQGEHAWDQLQNRIRVGEQTRQESKNNVINRENEVLSTLLEDNSYDQVEVEQPREPEFIVPRMGGKGLAKPQLQGLYTMADSVLEISESKPYVSGEAVSDEVISVVRIPALPTGDKISKIPLDESKTGMALPVVVGKVVTKDGQEKLYVGPSKRGEEIEVDGEVITLAKPIYLLKPCVIRIPESKEHPHGVTVTLLPIDSFYELYKHNLEELALKAIEAVRKDIGKPITARERALDTIKGAGISLANLLLSPIHAAAWIDNTFDPTTGTPEEQQCKLEAWAGRAEDKRHDKATRAVQKAAARQARMNATSYDPYNSPDAYEVPPLSEEEIEARDREWLRQFGIIVVGEKMTEEAYDAMLKNSRPQPQTTAGVLAEHYKRVGADAVKSIGRRVEDYMNRPKPEPVEQGNANETEDIDDEEEIEDIDDSNDTDIDDPQEVIDDEPEIEIPDEEFEDEGDESVEEEPEPEEEAEPVKVPPSKPHPEPKPDPVSPPEPKQPRHPTPAPEPPKEQQNQYKPSRITRIKKALGYAPSDDPGDEERRRILGLPPGASLAPHPVHHPKRRANGASRPRPATTPPTPAPKPVVQPSPPKQSTPPHEEQTRPPRPYRPIPRPILPRAPRPRTRTTRSAVTGTGTGSQPLGRRRIPRR